MLICVRTLKTAHIVWRIPIVWLILPRPFRSVRFNELSWEKKLIKVTFVIKRLEGYKQMPLSTSTAKALWLERLNFYLAFYKKLKMQLDLSRNIQIDMEVVQ